MPYVKDKYLFRSDSIEEIKRSIGYYDGFNPNEYLRVNQAKEKLNLDFDFQNWKTKIPHIRDLGTLYIHMNDLNLVFDIVKGKKEIEIVEPGLENFVNTRKAAELLQINVSTLSILLNAGKIKSTIRVPLNTKQTKWMIPMESIEEYKKQRLVSSNKKPQFMCLQIH